MRHLRVAVGILAAAPLAAFAYVDPNAGGWLYQLLFPLLIAIGALWAIMRQRISLFLQRWSGKKEGSQESGKSNTAQCGQGDRHE